MVKDAIKYKSSFNIIHPVAMIKIVEFRLKDFMEYLDKRIFSGCN